jgi:hypothetical protein
VNSISIGYKPANYIVRIEEHKKSQTVGCSFLAALPTHIPDRQIPTLGATGTGAMSLHVEAVLEHPLFLLDLLYLHKKAGEGVLASQKMKKMSF